jgi:transcriptional regulator with XRE-family HTH domain
MPRPASVCERAGMSITPEQVRQSRKLLGLSQDALAGIVGISRASVGEVERGDAGANPEWTDRIRAALEVAGVEFIARRGGGDGVRLKKAHNGGAGS